MAGAGDVNGDGYSDLIVGAEKYEHGETGEGMAFAFLGPGLVDVPLTDAGGGTHLLLQNYPNPFRGISGTTIRYTVADPCKVEIVVLDGAGRLVRRIEVEAHRGANSVLWNGRNHAGEAVPSGVYVLEIRAGGLTDRGKMLLVD